MTKNVILNGKSYMYVLHNPYHRAGQVGPGKGSFTGKDDNCESSLAIYNIVYLWAVLTSTAVFLKTPLNLKFMR